jgi:hypothetical protein
LIGTTHLQDTVLLSIEMEEIVGLDQTIVELDEAQVLLVL